MTRSSFSGTDTRPATVAGAVSVAVAVAVAIATVLAFAVAFAVVPGAALAAEPAGSPATGGDPRSPGQGPGLVGDPLLAIGVVIGVGVAALVLTLAYVRLTDRPGRHG